MSSLWICCSMLMIPSFFLLDILALIFCLACLAFLAPLANSSFWAVWAVFTANIQYFCSSIWNPDSYVKLISRRKQLSLATSLGASLDNVSISCMISMAFIAWRYPCHLSWREMFLLIHWECVIWSNFKMNCLVQASLLR